ncbi:proline racemase family protein [Brevundimonas sp. NPDC090276]|uniref:proline racemase family protein n=1 Tax=Brevundimonas sp. NPDC090276 TaxID=3363956 RepID=UPI00383A7B39
MVNDLGLRAERLAVIDMHTAGEPVRIFDATQLNIAGDTILQKRRTMGDRFDHLRRAMMLEPRGHADMYGAILVPPSHPAYDAAVLFTHNSGYSTMCGHATVALGRFLYDRARQQGRTQTRFTLECPCGPVAIEVAPDSDPAAAPSVRFESVESFALSLNDSIALDGFGQVAFDIGYGGAFYAILPSSRLGLDFHQTPMDQLVHATGKLVAELRATRSFRHPEEPDLSFLYGAILTDGDRLTPGRLTHNLCWFGEAQIDRSPTGSGVSARLAVAHAKGEIAPDAALPFAGASGQAFEGAVARMTEGGIIAAVSGRAYYMARSELILEAQDPFAHGFALPACFGDYLA